jgi:hypothetical protein
LLLGLCEALLLLLLLLLMGAHLRLCVRWLRVRHNSGLLEIGRHGSGDRQWIGRCEAGLCCRSKGCCSRRGWIVWQCV